ncbi:hypothetical protein A3H55_02515 [Candidatus Kuenenbacteria bacterium RIFCSPLOWO2_02_FULL_42_16]|uniref:Uncharacterized protein n=1 Tax=Candidatus Kuenenbacteria bacterium RIFCSPLOWO2_02_FULL_42_16 TaxID=1798564 RepID=A0A1F6G054_9BACT|nr:MAG: hypothetical protein A3H55_02515 [Candidatus Kuenenbacteria bacterium RIFCSPLOWO2_02_FULL_42_16]
MSKKKIVIFIICVVIFIIVIGGLYFHRIWGTFKCAEMSLDNCLSNPLCKWGNFTYYESPTKIGKDGQPYVEISDGGYFNCVNRF